MQYISIVKIITVRNRTLSVRKTQSVLKPLQKKGKTQTVPLKKPKLKKGTKLRNDTQFDKNELAQKSMIKNQTQQQT